MKPSLSPFRLDDDDDDDDDDDGEDGKKTKVVMDKGPGEYLAKSLFKQRVIMVAKPVDREMAAAICAQLLVMDATDKKAPITMYVNSPGGDADSGFGIYDVMKLIEAPITTVCLGLAASAAVIIYVGGRKDRRFALPHARFLIHQPSTYGQGPASDLEITANEIIKIRDTYNLVLSEEIGRSDKQILKDAHRDFWLTAQEAVDYGLVKSLVRSVSELPTS
jgi:ATP-dependent Clp protease protease subunit